MAIGSKKVLRAKLSPEDRFAVNFNFKSKFKRIQVNAAQRRESKKDSEQIHNKVISERKHILEAAIVKLMKANKTLRHTDLMTEILRLLRFPCDSEQIETRINDLIEK